MVLVLRHSYENFSMSHSLKIEKLNPLSNTDRAVLQRLLVASCITVWQFLQTIFKQYSLDSFVAVAKTGPNDATRTGFAFFFKNTSSSKTYVMNATNGGQVMVAAVSI